MSAIYDAMRPYQRYGAKWLRDAGNALLADQPGVGKTIQTLGTIIATAKRETPTRTQWHLVFCPTVAVDNVWEPEIHRWLWDHDVEVVALTDDLTLPRRDAKLARFLPQPHTKHVFVVTNLESARIRPIEDTKTGRLDWTMRRRIVCVPGPRRFRFSQVTFPTVGPAIPGLFTRVWDTIVVDESHRALIRKGGTPTQIRGGFMRLRTRRRIALSGTPMRGKPQQLWGTLNWLEPTKYPSYWKWVYRYWAQESSMFSGFLLGDFLPDGEDRLARDLKHIVLRRTKEEVAPELPPKTYAGAHLIPGDEESPLGIWLHMTPKQKRQLKQIEKDGVLATADGEVMSQGHLAEDTRRKQLAGAVHDVVNGKLVPTKESPKLQWVLDWLDNADGAQIVVASQFTSILNMFAHEIEAAGYTVALLTGKTSKSARKAGIDGFKNGEIQVFLLNTAAGGVALTLDTADYLVLLDETFIPDDQEQVEDRIHRISRIHNVTIYYLRMLDTVEEEIAFVTAARYSVTKYILDGARGVENARRLYIESRAA